MEMISKAQGTPDNIINLTRENFKKVVIESKKAFVIQIQADWCGECYIIKSILRQLAGHFRDQISVGYIDIETNEDIAKHYGVTELPFLLFFNHGELKHHLIGLQSKKKLRDYIQKTIACSDQK
ncbi:hypothetical protein JXA70_16555 [candidate division KSB1 bacterium]|nr:hypothetical protein [candidate division KSB1 bacterium]